MRYVRSKEPKYTYYVCSRYIEGLRIRQDPPACSPLHFPASLVDAAVIQGVLDLAGRPEQVAAQLEAYRLPDRAPEARREFVALDRALAELKEREAAAVEAQIAGIRLGASADAYAAVFADIAAARKDLEDRRGKLRRLIGGTATDAPRIRIEQSAVEDVRVPSPASTSPASRSATC